ncbi:hypothetical protein [Amycolatopsis speibonae]|uniref:Uncharacterized protein n=1 Tax=Amycolatopsis speibonae TaxID=1450224 RepID=A0ABV7P605_9PSEU
MNRQKPEQTRFGLTVTRSAQEIWCDEPGNVVHAWPTIVTTAA